MSRIILVALLASSPVLASAQTWSAQQEEIIEQIRRCNDAWVASIAQRRWDVYDSVCPATEQAVFWYPGTAPPAPYGGPKGVWQGSSARNRAVSWRDLKPITVQVDGDLALAYYTVTWIPVPHTGPATEAPSRRFTVFQRRAGRWLMAGGTIGPP